MARAQLLVGDHAGELEVQLPARRWTRSLLRRRGQQGVRSSDPVFVDDQDVRLDCLVERRRFGNRLQLPNGRILAQRNRQQHPPDRGRQPAHAHAEQVLDRLGHRQVVADARQVALRERPADLEREQGVAQGRVDQAP
jgi:hypothetical protein